MTLGLQERENQLRVSSSILCICKQAGDASTPCLPDTPSPPALQLALLAPFSQLEILQHGQSTAAEMCCF
jgi:hypothetical protein